MSDRKEFSSSGAGAADALPTDVASRPCDAVRDTRPRPVQGGERVASIDVLRGFALLGILPMNMVAFAWPMAGYENPHFSGGGGTANAATWIFNSLFFSGKMMSLFSMLFGAGLVLMAERAGARGTSILGTYYRRVFWLLVIGMVHAYLIWFGDILVMYALCGFMLYLFRRLSPRTLLIVSVVLLAIGTASGTGFIYYARFVSSVAERVDEELAAGREVAAWETALHRSWNEGLRSFARPNQADAQRDVDLYRSGYVQVVRGRAPQVFMFQIFGFLFFMLWGAGGRMLLGMALMKWGVFAAARSDRFYRRMALLAYGIGFPLTIWGIVLLWIHDYETLRTPLGATLFQLGMVPVALGHAAVIMMVCRFGFFRRLTSRLAAVGRTALSNYLLQSLLCTTLFYGYGLGLFGRVDRVGQWGIVLVIWAVQLAISPLWLSRYRYGPAEWLWRSLTYWRWQPMRNCQTPVPAAAP